MMSLIRWVGKKLFVILTSVIFCLRIVFVLIRYYLFSITVGCDNALLDTTDIMRGWRGFFGMQARRQVLGLILGQAFGDHVTVYSSLFSKKSITIGDNCYIGFDCNFGDVRIGRDVIIADSVIIMSGGHQHDVRARNNDSDSYHQVNKFKKVEIGDGAWIGAGAIIMADVGKDAIVGAGSVVTKPVLNNYIVGGVPARLIGMNSQ